MIKDWLVRNTGSNHVGRGLDAVDTEVDFGLAAMVRDVDVHGEEDFAAKETAVG